MAIEAAGAANSQTATNNENSVGSQIKKELGQDAFFKLLITQLQNQDPLKPMEDKEFIAQMAQFSSLEQMNNMNQNFNKLMDVQRVNQNSSLIGKTVESKIVGKESSREVTGEVIKISFEGDKTFAHLNNGNNDKINVDDITAIY